MSASIISVPRKWLARHLLDARHDDKTVFEIVRNHPDVRRAHASSTDSGEAGLREALAEAVQLLAPDQGERASPAFRAALKAQALAAHQAGEKVSAPSHGGWLPIETAPVIHGCEVDLWLASGERIADARGFQKNGVLVWHRMNDDGLHQRIHEKPTHWMLPPDAPNTTGKAPEAAREGS